MCYSAFSSATFLKITVGKVRCELDDYTKHLATPLLFGKKSLREKYLSLSKCGITNTPDDTENGICSKVLGSASTTDSRDMFEKIPGDGEGQRACFAAIHGISKSHTQLSYLNNKSVRKIFERDGLCACFLEIIYFMNIFFLFLQKTLNNSNKRPHPICTK